MKVKKLIPFSCILILLLLCCSGILPIPSTRFLFFFFSAFSAIFCIPAIFFPKLKMYLFQLSLLAVVSFLLMHIQAKSTINTSLAEDTVTSLSGTLIYDSSLTANGNSIMTIKLSSCSNIYANTSSASGLATVLWESSEAICAGCSIQVEGRFSDNLFIASSLTVKTKKTIHYLRQRLILAVRQRVLNSGSTVSSLLSLQLLLGTAEDGFSEIRTLARNCGCLHVLALSGMHLNVLTSMCNIFGKKKKFTKFLKYSIATLFVFIAGPRPSLIRALLMVYLSFLPPEENLISTFLIQCLLFPYHIVNIGCIFAYASTFALLVFSPYISYLVTSLLGTSVSVLLLNAPVQLLFTGCWYPLSIFAGPVAAFLAACSMSLGLLKLAFPAWHLIDRANNIVFNSMSSLFEHFSRAGLFWKGYLAFLGLLALVFALAMALKIQEKQKLQTKYKYSGFWR